MLNLTTNCRRHYGALQGLDKQETVDKYGKDQVNVWLVGSACTPSRHSTSDVLPLLTWTIGSIWCTRRRSYDVPPPEVDVASTHFPGNDPMYMSNAEASLIKTESLKVRLLNTVQCIIPCSATPNMHPILLTATPFTACWYHSNITWMRFLRSH